MSEHVFWNLECSINEGKLEEVKALMDELVEATQSDEPGALNYEWSISEDETTLHLFERYADSDATLVHLGSFGSKFASRFMGIVQVTRFTVYGNPNEQVRKALTPMGVEFMTPLGGFSR